MSASAVQQDDPDAGASLGGQDETSEDPPEASSSTGLVVGLVIAVLFLTLVVAVLMSQRSAKQQKDLQDMQDGSKNAATLSKTNPTYQYVVGGGGNGGNALYAGVDGAPAGSASDGGADYNELSAADMAVGYGLQRAAVGNSSYETAAVYEDIDEHGVQRGQPGYLAPVALGDALYLEPVEQPQYVDPNSSEYPDMYGTLAGMAGMSMYDVAGGGHPGGGDGTAMYDVAGGGGGGGGEAMYDTAAAGGEAMYDTAAAGGDAMYDHASGGMEESWKSGPASSRGMSKRTSDDLDSFKPLTLTRGATGQVAQYEYSMAAGGSADPTYALASGEAAEEVAYVLANGDVGATGAPAEYVLANGSEPMYDMGSGSAFEEPMYDTATEDDGYLSVLPDVYAQVNKAAKTGSGGNVYNMLAPGTRSQSVSGRQQIEAGHITSTDGEILRDNDFV